MNFIIKKVFLNNTLLSIQYSKLWWKVFKYLAALRTEGNVFIVLSFLFITIVTFPDNCLASALICIFSIASLT